MTARIRPASLADLDAIMRLELETFPTDAWSRESMRDELASPHGHYIVAVADADADAEHEGDRPPRALAGYAGLRCARGSAQADVQTIAVAATYRRAGLGRALLAALLDEATRRGARDVFLEVRADNEAAQRLYRSVGFETIATRPRYYQPDDVDALVMRLAVREEVARA